MKWVTEANAEWYNLNYKIHVLKSELIKWLKMTKIMKEMKE